MNKKLEDVVVKTIAGFSNASDGTLLVGVIDDGEVKGPFSVPATHGRPPPQG